MDSLRVLVVPSRMTEIDGFPSLPNMQREILAITTGYESTVLNEPVRWIDMLRAVTGDKEYDIYHYGGHLTDAGLVLGSEIVSVNHLIMMIQTGKPLLVVMNSCSGELAAERIASQCSCDVIYAITGLDNDIAITFAITFYSQLRKAESFKSAFAVASTGESVFRYLDGKYSAVERGDSLATDVAEVKRALFDPYGGNGLVQRVIKLEQWMQGISGRLDGTRTVSAVTYDRLTLVIVVVVIILGALLFRGANGG